MSVRYRTATGNWSNAAQWDGGTLPTSADDCYCNGFTITLDQDVTAVSIRNDSLASPVIAAGGQINIATIASTRTVTANFICNSTTSLLNCLATSGTLNLVGNGTRGNTGNDGRVLLLNNCPGSTVNWTGTLTAGTGGWASNAVAVNATFGTFNHIGSAVGSTVATAISLNGTGARTVSVGTMGPNGLAVAGGTGAGHTVTITDIDNTVAGFSVANSCVSIGGIIADATINTTGDIATGTCFAVFASPVSGSGAINMSVNGGNGDVYWCVGAASMIAFYGATTMNLTCRDIYAPRVGTPNGYATILANGVGAAATLNITARNVLPGTVSGNGGGGILNLSTNATVNLTVSGSVNGGSGSVSNMPGAMNYSTGTFNLYGIARGGTSTGSNCPGFNNASTGLATVTTAIASNAPNGGEGYQFGTLQGATSGYITVDSSEDGSGGWPACSGRTFVRAGSNGQIKMRESNAGTIKTFGANPTDYPIPANVRDGTTYNSGAQTGTLKVPPAGSVATGVPVDATVGTAVLNGVTLAQIEASTVLAMKADVTAVPGAVRANLATELARIDVATSSRLAAVGYTAPLDSTATQAAASAALTAFDPATVADLLAAVGALQADNATTQASIGAIKSDTGLIPGLF